MVVEPYIFDRKAMSILKFDNLGRYSGQIGRIGQGPGEYFNIANFCIDKSQKNIVILTNLGSIYNYSLDGDFIDNYKLAGDKVVFQDFKIINSDTLLFWRPDNNEQLHLYSTKARSFIKHLHNKGEEHNFAANVFYEYDRDVFFTRSLSDKVYKLNENCDLVVSHRWDFGVKNIDLSKYDLPASISESGRKLWEMYVNSEFPYVIVNQKQNKKYHYSRVYFNNEDNVHVFYDKISNKSRVIEEFAEGLRFFPLYWSNDYVVGISEAHEKTAINKDILDEENAQIFLSIKELDNPCLVKYYFKK